ncbi:MAG: hypothetical protein MJ093_08245, partial [Saccharofermentans sp.]|nr:hypothetical protein [Saccharofermentans sp.]
MAIFTRLASTLTAKYFPSQTLTDAFYIDGRLFGKRETRQADITIDKEERGFFFSVFSHPKINGYEPGMMPPYEPQLRGTCNEVKFGKKEIDGMISGFLSTAVDVTGKMKLQDNDARSPYFSGIIVRDSEAFAITIGSGLAFLYRDDTLFPLTDAGIPMEPIDANGNRVGDFLYYCSSKTANALWSNIFTLSPDDCIILCNKEIYDALGQREILRILTDAEDQCDAAGVIITQASARMPNVPMQFSISFVESVVSDEKKGIFGFKKKAKEEDMSDMSIKSTFEGGLVGAAAEAAADAGFAQGLQMTQAPNESSLFFGDNSQVAAPISNQPASSDKGIEILNSSETQSSPIEFLDTSINKEPAVEMSAEEMMMNLFGMSKSSAPEAPATPVVTPAPVVTPTPVAPVETPVESPFVSSFVVPTAASIDKAAEEKTEETVEMKTVSTTEFKIDEDDDNSKTKPILSLESSIIKSLMSDAEKKEEPVEEVKPVVEETPVEVAPAQIIPEVKFDIENAEVVPKETPIIEETIEEPVKTADEIVFEQTDSSGFISFGDAAPSATAEFDPYSVGSADDMKNTAALVFGDDGIASAPTKESYEEAAKADNIPVPDFEIKAEKPELKEDDKLKVDFPEKVEEEKTDILTEEKVEESFELPFENAVGVFSDDTKTPKADDIPDMPVFGANTYETPVVATNSEQPINQVDENVYSYGQYVENENMDSQPAQYPVENSQPAYQSFGTEGYAYQTESVNPGYETGYQYENQYQTGAQAPVNDTPVDSGAGENDWINSILGIDDDMDVGYQEPTVPVDNGGATMSNNSYTYPNQRPASTAPRRPSGNGYRPQGGGAGNGRGGRKVPKLNRNGYIFIAFVL